MWWFSSLMRLSHGVWPFLWEGIGGHWAAVAPALKDPPPFEKAPRVQPGLGNLERISARISYLSFEGSLRTSWTELLVAPSLLPRFLVPWLSIISETGVLWL